MLREDRDAAAGAKAGGEGAAVPARPPVTPAPSQPRRSIFDRRSVPPLSPQERAVRTDAIERSLQFGAEPVRDGRGWALEVDFIEANREAVEPWKHDRRDKRFYRRSQQVAKAAGQLIGQPGDRIELATRFARLHRREGSDVEGAVRRGLFDAIWRFDHVYDSYTVPRRYGTHTMKTGRVAAVAEEARRRWQAEGLAPADAFWVRNRRNTGLVLVSPNPDPDAPSPEVLQSGEGIEMVVGQADLDQAFDPFLPSDDFDIPTESYDPSGFYRFVEGDDGRALFVFDPGADGADARRPVDARSLDDLAEGFIAALDAGRDSDDPQWQQSARLLAEFLPGTGHVISAREAYLAFRAASTAMQNGDWEEALLKGGESLLNAAGAVPALGDLLRFGKGAVKLANLLLQMGRRLDVEPQVLAMAAAGGGAGKSGKGASPGIGHNVHGGGSNKRFVLPESQKSITILEGATTPIWKSFPETGTRLYRVSGEPVSDWVLQRGYPLGFRSSGHYKSFIQPLQEKVRILDPNAIIAIRGSAVTGQGFDKVKETYTKGFFDSGAKPSDYDISIVSSALLDLAEQQGIKIYRETGNSRVIKGKALDKVELRSEFDEMMRVAGGREVSLVIYDTLEELQAKGTMMTLGRELGAVR